MSTPKRKKTGLDEALEDIKAGRGYGPFDNTEDLFKALGIDIDKANSKTN